MSLMDLFRPKWKHSYWEVRRAAVERLEDPALLAVIAQDDKISLVREAAVSKVEDQEVLSRVATNDEVWSVRKTGVERLQSQEVLAEVAKSAGDVDVRVAAVRRLDGQAVLARIAEDDEHGRVRAAATEKVTDPTLRAALAATARARNSHPIPGMVYMHVPGPECSAVCSDNNCPCTEDPIAWGDGYMYVSEDVAKLRREHPSVAEIKAWRAQSGEHVMFGRGNVAPVLTCGRGARLRNLDMLVAAQDAKYWWETFKVPCRATPKSS